MRFMHPRYPLTAVVILLLFFLPMLTSAAVSTDFEGFAFNTPAEMLNIPGVTFNGSNQWAISTAYPGTVYSSGGLLVNITATPLEMTFIEPQSSISFSMFLAGDMINPSIILNGYLNGQLVLNTGVTVTLFPPGTSCSDHCGEAQVRLTTEMDRLVLIQQAGIIAATIDNLETTTPTPSLTPSHTPTFTPTNTLTNTPTNTATPTATGVVTPLGIGNYEETNNKLTYTGNWLNYVGAGPRGGSMKYSNDPNAKVAIPIADNVARITVYYTKNTVYGAAALYQLVSGTPTFIGTIPGNGPLAWAQPITFVLPGGSNRVLEIRNTSNMYIGFEAFNLLGAATPTPSLTPSRTPTATLTPTLTLTASTTAVVTSLGIGNYEETNSKLTYSGNWLNYVAPQPRGGSMKYSNDPNARVSFPIADNVGGVTIYRTMNTNYGAMALYQIIVGNATLIGNIPGTGPLAWGVPITFTLPAGTNRTLELRNTSSMYIGLEAFNLLAAVTPTNTPTAIPTSGPLGLGNYEETHPNLTYIGNWLNYVGTGPRGGSFRYTNDPNARLLFSVVNTAERVIIYRTLANGYGPIGVYVDGSFIGNMPASTTLTWGAPYIIPLTPNGSTRVIELRNTSSQYVGIEALDVALNPASPTPIPPLSPGLYQENNPNLSYSGVWTSYSGPGLNGTSLLYSNDLNARVRFIMSGDALRIYRTLASNRGSISVCVDSVTPCTIINNNNPSVVWNAPVTIGSLGAGTHTIVISNVSASTSLYIDLDAIEVLASTTSSSSLPGAAPIGIPTAVPTSISATVTFVLPATPTMLPTPIASPLPSLTPLPTEAPPSPPAPGETPVEATPSG